MTISIGKFKKLHDQLENTVNNSNLESYKNVTKLTVDHESLVKQPELYADAQAKASRLDEMILTALQAANISHEEYNDAQLALARQAAHIAVAQEQGTNIGKMIADGIKKSSSSGMSAVDLGLDYALSHEELSVALESYDGQKQNNPFILSVLYNFTFASQDEFVEAFFPSVPLDPTTSDIVVEVSFVSLMKEFYRDINGGSARDKFNKIPLIKAIYDANIFDTDKTLIVPVLRDSNKELFLEDEKFESTESLETVTTAPLVFGKKIDLIGVSQTDLELSKGKADNTDALDRSLVLSKLYYSIEDGGATEMFSYDLRETADTSFIYYPAGHEKDMMLRFTNNTLVIHTGTTTTSKGTSSTILGKLPANYTIGFGVKVYGEANTQHGDVELSVGGGVKIKYILNAAGQKVPESDSSYISIASVINKITLRGFILTGHTTNSNLRKRGQLLTVDTLRKQFPVCWRSGFTIMGPVKSETGTDNDINSQVLGGAQALGAKMSVMGVSKLLGDIETLKYLTNDGTKQVDRTEFETGFLGMGQYLLEPTYYERDINLTTIVDGTNSSSRDDDIRNSLLQAIYNAGMELYLKSDYGVVFEKGLVTTDAARPTLIVGTDPNIKRLLVKDKDTIQLGNTFDIRVVSTFDQRVAGKIILSFGIFDGQRNSVPNVMNYGYTATSAAIVYDLVRDTNNQTSREITTQPRFTHYTNIPVVALFTISGIEAVFGKLAIHTKNV